MKVAGGKEKARGATGSPPLIEPRIGKEGLARRWGCFGRLDKVSKASMDVHGSYLRRYEGWEKR